MALACDMADWAQVQAALQAVQARWGRIDLLVNNAGVIDPIARLAEADPAAWARAIDINLTGVFHGMRAAVPLMQAQGRGRSSPYPRARRIAHWKDGAPIAPARRGRRC